MVGSRLLATFRIIKFVGVILAVVPLQTVFLMLNLPISRWFPRKFHRGATKALGFDVVTRGKMEVEGPVLYVSNHISYTDIVILGGILPAVFISKAEVAGWPIFGFMAKLQRTVFVERRRRNLTAQKTEIENRLDNKENLILFPEGTSTDGRGVRRFKSALFSVAQNRVKDQYIKVQPVSIAYSHLDGMPVGFHLRPFFGWYGDMALAPHLWKLAGLGRAQVTIEFHEPVTMDAFESRKEMAEYCQQKVAHGVARTLAGRALPVPHAV